MAGIIFRVLCECDGLIADHIHIFATSHLSPCFSLLPLLLRACIISELSPLPADPDLGFESHTWVDTLSLFPFFFSLFYTHATFLHRHFHRLPIGEIASLTGA